MGKFNGNGPKGTGGGSTLSSRFASISTKPAGGKKRTPVKGQNKKDVTNKGKPQQRNGKKQQAKKGGEKREIKKPANKDDLDMDMDKYWFQAGKGPNPDIAALDKDLEDYVSKKADSPAVTEEVVVAAPAPVEA